MDNSQCLSPDSAKHQAHTGKCLLAICRLDWDPKLPKKVVPKLGFPGSVSLPKPANCSGQSSQMLWSGSLS